MFIATNSKQRCVNLRLIHLSYCTKVHIDGTNVQLHWLCGFCMLSALVD